MQFIVPSLLYAIAMDLVSRNGCEEGARKIVIQREKEKGDH
ncbi:MAG: hypothetical protein AAF193_00425 [Bacteroidota bacterium]